MDNPVFILLIILSLIILCCAFLLRYWIKRLGILSKSVIYSDSKQREGFVIESKRIKLHGKPDFLIEENGFIYPVEFKKRIAPFKPYNNHIMQLMAYCYLVEEHFGKRPEFGFIKYLDKEFKVEYNESSEKYLVSLVSEIYQNKQNETEIHCSHPNHYS